MGQNLSKIGKALADLNDLKHVKRVEKGREQPRGEKKKESRGRGLSGSSKTNIARFL